MIKLNLQLFGGRGTGSYSASAQFSKGGLIGIGGSNKDLNVAGWTPDAGHKSVNGTKTLNSAEKKIQNLDHEQLVVVGKDGYVMAVVDGGEHSVGLTAKALKEIQAGGIMTHNHPNGGTFSTTDIITAGDIGAKEIRAVSKTTGKSYSLKAGNKADGSGLSYAMRKAENSIINSANNKLDSTVNKRKYANKNTYMKAVDKVWDDTMGEWLNANASKYGYSYSSVKTGKAN